MYAYVYTFRSYYDACVYEHQHHHQREQHRQMPTIKGYHVRVRSIIFCGGWGGVSDWGKVKQRNIFLEIIEGGAKTKYFIHSVIFCDIFSFKARVECYIMWKKHDTVHFCSNLSWLHHLRRCTVKCYS